MNLAATELPKGRTTNVGPTLVVLALASPGGPVHGQPRHSNDARRREAMTLGNSMTHLHRQPRIHRREAVDSFVMGNVTIHPLAGGGCVSRVGSRFTLPRVCDVEAGDPMEEMGVGVSKNRPPCPYSHPLPEKNDPHVVVLPGPLTLALSRREREQHATPG